MRRLFTLALIVLLGVSLFALAPQAVHEPSADDLSWVGQNRPRALDALMPMRSTGFCVAYRRYRDVNPDGMEQYFLIRFAEPAPFSPDRYSATVVTPVSRSIQRQLLDLHIKDRKASLESLLPLVAVRRQAVDSTACRNVKQQMDRLGSVDIRVHDKNRLFGDPFLHRLVVQWSEGEMDVTLYDEQHALARWASETMEALSACSR
jgi:hypothetical protein